MSTRQISVEEGASSKTREHLAPSALQSFRSSAEHKQGLGDANGRILGAKAGGSSAAFRPIWF